MNYLELQYEGVKGWLLVLCVCLTIFDPLAILLNLVIITTVLKPLFAKHDGLLRLIMVNGICSIGLAVYSIYAGMSLWKIAPNAVITAKRYLYVAFIYSIASIFLPYLMGLPEDLQSQITGNTTFNSLITLIYFIAWYQYLCRSRRVKATYPLAKTDKIV